MKEENRVKVEAWKNPAWITAMVGLLGAFLTVPEVLSTFLTMQQKVELARVENEKAKIDNTGLQQNYEFEIVSNTLAHQGTERIFVLRYLAATLNDTDAKKWAVNEVTRIERITDKEKDLAIEKQNLIEKEEQLSNVTGTDEERRKELENEIESLRESLTLNSVEISKLTKDAGISSQTGISIEDGPYIYFRGSLTRTLISELQEKLGKEGVEVSALIRTASISKNSIIYFYKKDQDIANRAKGSVIRFFQEKGCPISNIEIEYRSIPNINSIKQGELEFRIYHACRGD